MSAHVMTPRRLEAIAKARAARRTGGYQMTTARLEALARARAVRDRTVELRFWEKVDQSAGTDACWLWTGSRTADGYGRLSVDGNPVKAPRVAMSIHLGRPLAGSEHVLHACDNPPCVNPAHLHLGTHQQNMAEATERGRMLRGEDQPNAKLTAAQVLAIRERRRQGATWSRLAAEFATPERTVRAAASGRTWAHLPGAVA